MSRTRIAALTAGGALALALAAAAAPATAASQVTYNGTFTDVTFDTGCTDPAGAPTTASGTWRVNLHENKATARFVINVDDVPHVAWTTQMTRIADDEATFKATTSTPAGSLIVTLVDTTFTYRISPYNVNQVFSNWPVCNGQDGVTYSGVVGPAG